MSAQTETPLRVGQQVRSAVVRELQRDLSGAEGVVVAKMEKVPTRDLNQLRDSLKELRAGFLVVKNSLGQRTFRNMGWSDLEKLFKGTCGVAPIRGDEVGSVCKKLADFSKGHDGFVLQGGMMSGKVLTAGDLTALAKLPSRPVLLSQLLGSMQAPVVGLVSALQGLERKLLVIFHAIAQKKEQQQ
ncbi:MAG: 50S ribosomal protein L10 [Candidatus Omnitrophica bacterium]|nr:50S ribosomal protein L10 [Candidatus Omnitrophota bacterium]